MKQSFNMKEKVIQLAEQFGYKIFFERPNSLIRFKRDNRMVDVWYSTMTIGIYENGTQKFYKNVSLQDISEYL